MKKKILGGLLVVAIAAVAAFNVNMNTEKNELSLLALMNVEALASGEEAGITCHRNAESGRWNQCWESKDGGCVRNGNPRSACKL